jgi:hypothetical protein
MRPWGCRKAPLRLGSPSPREGERTVRAPIRAPVIVRGVCSTSYSSFLPMLNKVKVDKQHTAPTF